MHCWMMFICMGNASNLTTNVAFQTAWQLLDEAFYHLHCNITRSSHGLYTVSLLGTFLPLILELFLVVRCKKVLFCPDQKCPSGYIGWRLDSHYLSTSLLTPGLMKHLLNSLNAMLCYVSLKCCSHLFERLKLMPIFRPISSVFDVKVCPSTARQFLQAGKTIQKTDLPYYYVLCHKSSFILKCCLLAKIAVQENHKSLNMLIQWGEGLHKPRLLHVYFSQFCPLL